MQAYDTSEILKFYRDTEAKIDTMTDEEGGERVGEVYEAFKDWPKDELQSFVIDLICTAFKQNTFDTIRLLHYTQKRLNDLMLIATGKMLEEKLREKGEL